ncbi:MAG: beta-hydroxyacyl-ACP dehydratase, partial [Evtepia sp.]
LCEMLAQSACVLLADQVTKGSLTLLTGMNKVRFREPVRPGDTVETICKINRAKPPFYFAEGQASVRGIVALKAEFSFAVMA